MPLRPPVTRALTIIVATGDAERLHAALTFAAASAAMGTETRVHLHEGAVALMRDLRAPNDGARTAAGLPTLAQIRGEAQDIGVKISVCQSGLALAGLTLEDFDERVEAQGPIGVLTIAGDDRLIVF